MDGEDFLVFFNVRAMIQFNNHAETVASDRLDKDQIGNVKDKPFSNLAGRWIVCMTFTLA